MSSSPQVSNAALIGQGKKISDKGKGVRPPEKERKMLLRQLLVQPLQLSPLLT